MAGPDKPGMTPGVPIMTGIRSRNHRYKYQLYGHVDCCTDIAAAARPLHRTGSTHTSLCRMRSMSRCESNFREAGGISNSSFDCGVS